MIVILLGNGFEEAEALVPADLMRRAGLEVALAALSGDTVTGGHSVMVKADLSLSALDEKNVELVMLPGGLGGVNSLLADPAALHFVQEVYRTGGRVAAICAAPVILAKLGLLKDRKAVCYPGMESQLTGAFPQTGVPVVEDGPIITGEAAGSAFAFGLKLVEILKGTQAAAQVKNSVFYRG